MNRLPGWMCVGLCSILGGLPWVSGQPLGDESVEMAYRVDSGWRSRPAVLTTDVVFDETVAVPDAGWLRLYFSDWTLGESTGRESDSYLRITSLDDGAVQYLDSKAMRQWRGSTAYFNGDAVHVELIVPSENGLNRVVLDRVEYGTNNPSAATLCGADDRVLSQDPRVARIRPVGCTGFLIGNHPYLFLTAGHCGLFNGSVVQFNVPLSSPTGSIRHPGPEDQYVIDRQSDQGRSSGLGDDWRVFAAFPNANTRLTPLQAQGASFEVVTRAPLPDGGVIRITGHGGDDSPLSHNSVQQTDTGTYDALNNLVIAYNDLDTTGGLSGGPIEHLGTGFVYGIHTSGGCNPGGGGANRGTAMTNANLQRALAEPRSLAIVDRDCNANEVLDADDISSGASIDANANGDPDECESGGDADGDGDVDRIDFATFAMCQESSADAICGLMDFDDDLDVGLSDFGRFQAAFDGDCGLTLTEQPVGLFDCAGTATTLTVNAAGDDVSYQWYRGVAALLGETGPTLDVTLAENTLGRYRCRVTGNCSTKNSDWATFSIPDGPVITEQPVNPPLCLSASASFAISADGFGVLNYQWQLDGNDIPGANGPTYEIAEVGEDDGGFYRCVVTDGCGQEVVSDAATLIDTTVEILSQPSEGNACPDSPHFMFVSQVGGQGFQWYRDGEAIDGATSFFFEVTEPGTYSVEVIGACESIFSEKVVVTSDGC